MEGLPLDVVQFVERRFSKEDQPAVFRQLESPALTTHRVMRAVLYLSNGSRSMLEHYVTECSDDVRDILTRAEFVQGVADQPMPVRDMSLPFTHQRNLGGDFGRRDLAGMAWLQATKPKAARAPARTYHHPELLRRVFKLGKVTYLVAGSQNDSEHVRCYRMDGKVSRIVRLPVAFVVEQLAERIDLEAISLP